MSSIFYIFVVLFLLATVMSEVTQAEKVRMCYFTNWAQYRPGKGRFRPQDIDPFVCTHVLYAFAFIDLAGEKPKTIEWNDEQMYKDVVALKKVNPRLKVLAALGGASGGTAPFDTIARSEDKTRRFVQNTIAFLRSHQLDGVDVDWEFPNTATKTIFERFLRLFSEGFREESRRSGQDKMTLTVAVSGNPNKVQSVYDPREIARSVDYVLLMAYDLWGPWTRTLGHQSPLFVTVPGDPEQGQFSVHKVVKKWADHGSPSGQLVMGMPTYGRTGKLSSASRHNMGDAWTKTGASAGPFTRAPGVLAYYEICDKLRETGWTTKYTTPGDAAYAWNSKSLEFISYDDLRSFQAKADYIVDQGLGGAMFWTVDDDDFSGKSCQLGKYPLLNKVKDVFEGSGSSGGQTTRHTTTTTTTTTRRPRPTRRTTTTTTRRPRPTRHTTTTTTRRPRPTRRTTTTTTRRPRPTRRTTTTTTTPKPPTGGSTNDCGPFACPSQFGYYPDPADCAKFYRCSRGKAISVPCPPKLLYDRASQRCLWDYTVTCQVTTC